jgi:hypothetical protein
MESPGRGKSLSIDLQIGFREAVLGSKRSVSLSRLEPCEFCQGKGIRRRYWWSIFPSSCVNCHGRGITPKMQTIEITIPQGVTEERTLILEGEGDAGQRGADRGDLRCRLLLAESECFSRQGLDIISSLEVTQLQFDQGCSLSIDTINGLELIRISASSCIDGLLRLEKRGLVRVLIPAGATVNTPYGAFKLVDAELEEGDHVIHIVITENPQPPPKFRDEDALDSQIGINYRQLRDYLRERQWNKADIETHNLMLQTCGRVELRDTQYVETWLAEKSPEFSPTTIGKMVKGFLSSSREQGWLDERSIKQFPCQDLRTIDRLWRKYSNGRFGFTAQKSVWETCYRPTTYQEGWNNFKEKLGWKISWSIGGLKYASGRGESGKFVYVSLWGLTLINGMVPYEKCSFEQFGELPAWTFLASSQQLDFVAELLFMAGGPQYPEYWLISRIQSCALELM